MVDPEIFARLEDNAKLVPPIVESTKMVLPFELMPRELGSDTEVEIVERTSSTEFFP